MNNTGITLTLYNSENLIMVYSYSSKSKCILGNTEGNTVRIKLSNVIFTISNKSLLYF